MNMNVKLHKIWLIQLLLNYKYFFFTFSYGEVKDRAREAGPGFGLPGYRLHVYI
jgi:hypothetical protein